MIRVISPIRPVRFDDLRAVAISILVEWGVVIGSSILVLVLAVATFILVVRGIVVGCSILVAVFAVAISLLVEWGGRHGELYPRIGVCCGYLYSCGAGCRHG